MVTRILLDPRRDLPAGTTDSTPVTIEATPTGIREDGSTVILPTTLTFEVDTGADIVQLAPPTASWAWRITARNSAGVVLQTRTVRFPDVPTIAYAALTDVDPASLGETTGHARQWDATFFQLLDILADIQTDTAGWTAKVDAILASSSTNLDTFFEVATRFGLDEATVTTLQALVAGKATPADIATAVAAQAASDAATYVAFKNFDGTPVTGKHVQITLTADGTDIDNIQVVTP